VRTALLVLLLFIMPAQGQPRPVGTDYTVSLRDASAQIIRVEARVDRVSTDSIDFTLPTWRSGRYVILDFASTVRDVTASDADGLPLDVRKVDKTTWRVRADGAETVTLTYAVFADARDNRTRYVDATHCFFDASAVLVYNPDRRSEDHRVRIADTPGDWTIATGLEPDPVVPDAWLSPTYDVLADSPFEMGELDVYTFESHGIPHEITIWADPEVNSPEGLGYDPEELIEDFKLITDEQIELFGSAPYQRYVYMVHVYPGAGGGTEHLNSTIMQTRPSVFRDDERYTRFLSLVAHELFHTWNVKNFRPTGITPYDFVHENYTPDLWIVEGTTSYYDDLTLARTGQKPIDDYLEHIASGTASTRGNHARFRQSLSESSWDAWIHLFALQRHADRANVMVNFYGRGALASLCLDLRIRELTGNERSLDDVMREMNERFPWQRGGYTPQQFRDVASEVARADLTDWFVTYIDNAGPLPLEESLAIAGLELTFEPDEEPYLGLRTRTNEGGRVVTGIDESGPAFGSGLVAGDRLIAINDERIGTRDPQALVEDLEPGDAVELTYFHHDRLRTGVLTIAQSPYGDYTLERIDEPTEMQRAVFESWSKQPWHTPEDDDSDGTDESKP
jgi:predicted metalloprotease with PDZ domain